MDSNSVNNKLDKELVLHFLDQTLAANRATLQTQNRTWLFLNIFSFILIAISGGIITLSQTISALGFMLSIPTWIFLLGGAYIVGVLFIATLSAIVKINDQFDLIIDLYELLEKESGNIIKAQSRTWREILNNGLQSSVFFDLWETLTKAKYVNFLLGFIFAAIFFLLPLTAEIFAFYKMIVIFGWTWWIIVSFLILLFVTLSTIVGVANKL